MTELDYQKLGFKCGIEIHQQLETHKLFCGCPTVIREDEPDFVIRRKMRAVAGEVGDIDPAALYEFLRDRAMVYQGYYTTTCLVELDEEPPHQLNQEALNAVLEAALLLNARPVDELQVMRKTVIDGSNTSGFQRTIFVAMDGTIETAEGKVRIPTICLEEDAARKISEEGSVTTYRLDRLGIPLVEIATDPDIKTPAHGRAVAEKLGMILRATGKVKRGLGTIRQDLNVSITGGGRVEVKGVQDLKLIEDVLRKEVERQVMLIEVKEELWRRNPNGENLAGGFTDVSDAFAKTGSKMVANMLEKGACVLAVKLPGFSGLLKDKLGPELAQYAKSAAGVKGIFHSDELPEYGISLDEVTAVKKELSLEENDAFALVVEQKDVAEKALNEVIGRCRTAFLGVPKETRRARDDGSSEFMRPLPGSARMYPETDEVPVALPAERLKKIRENLSETPEKRMSRYIELGVGSELAGQLVKSKVADDFDSYVKMFPNLKASLIAGTLLSSLKEAKKKYGVDAEKLEKTHFTGVFRLISAGKITKESIVEVVAELAKNPQKTAEAAANELGLGSLSDTEIDKVVGEIIAENLGLIEKLGDGAAGALMGKAMAKLRGKAEAGKVAAAIKLKLGK